MREFIKYTVLCGIALTLAGCFGANSSTTGNTTTRKYDVGVKVTNTGEGTYNNYFYLGATASTDTQSEQVAEGNVASDTTELKASLTGDGGTASFAERGAEMFMEGVSSSWQAYQEYMDDKPPVEIKNDPPSKTPVGTPAEGVDDSTPPWNTVEPSDVTDNARMKVPVSIYEVDQYEDGRWRYLFRTTMELLPAKFSIYYNGTFLYNVNRVGDRWQGPNDVKGAMEPLLKNSHGRAHSVSLLLPKNLDRGTVILRYTEQVLDDEVGGDLTVLEEAPARKRDPPYQRERYYFSKMMKQYPKDFKLVIGECGTWDVVGNVGDRIDFNKDHVRVNEVLGSAAHGMYLRQSMVIDHFPSGAKQRGMVVAVSEFCKAPTATIMVPVTKKAAPTVKYTQVETLKLRSYDTTRSFEWTQHEGLLYGQNFRVVFGNDCGEMIVPDGSKGYAPNGNMKDYSQPIWMSGDPAHQPDTNPAGIKPPALGKASIFTKKGCTSDSATIHYN